MSKVGSLPPPLYDTVDTNGSKDNIALSKAQLSEKSSAELAAIAHDGNGKYTFSTQQLAYNVLRDRAVEHEKKGMRSGAAGSLSDLLREHLVRDAKDPAPPPAAKTSSDTTIATKERTGDSWTGRTGASGTGRTGASGTDWPADKSNQ